ncbi:tape measure protein [Oceanobacillus oncorhynchi]|uniref:tape measure protein n=1 Tax=Oceanobacillus oncorhynchi TaxID=545501 RepID=UPI0025A3DC1F|nr:tape measure protein [Oceanobacillus oncorhynchi]MDM8100932.1 tape measure protein [Oceanobacillus oncorhynchi]
MKSVESGLEGITGATGGAESGMHDVGDSMDSLHDSGSSAGVGIDTVDVALGGMMDSSSSASGALDNTGSSLDDLGSSGDSASSGLDVVDSAMDSIDGSSGNTSASVSDVSAALEDAGISGESAGAGIAGASDSLEGVGGSSEQAKDGLDGVGDSADETDISMNKLIKTISGIAATVGIFRVLRNAVDLAFRRIDTMEQFERVMTEMTGSTTDANAALDKTNDIVTGTAYGLDVAASSVQDFVTRGVEVGEATKYIEAWGDAVAFYGNGSNEQFANVTNALQNMLTKGKVGMDQLNRLFEAGIPAVDIYAQATGRSVDEVSEALSDGEISAEEFVNTVTTAMMEGTNGVTNISGAAKEAGASWSGAFANMGAAAARGVTAIIEAIDGMLTNNGLPTMRDMVSEFGSFMESSMKTAAAVIEPVGNALLGLLGVFSPLLAVVKPFVPVIGAMTATFTGLMIVKSVGTALMGFRASLMAVQVIQKSVAVVTAATTFAMTLFSGATVASAAGASGLSVAVTGLRVALSALLGPVGWIITGAAGLAAGIYAVWNHFNKASEETEQLKEETDALGESTDALIDSMNESASAYQDRVNDIDATREANNELLSTVEDLAEKENKSAEDKRNLSIAVEQLNGSVDGLNASYNEEADMLSESTEKMQARIDLMAEQDKGNAAQERLTEILKEQQEVELQLDEVIAMRKEWNSTIQESGNDTADARIKIQELDEQEQELLGTLDELGIQYETTKDTMVESSQNAKDIIADNNQDIIVSYEDLEGKAKDAFDALAEKYGELKDAATDAFEKIDNETEHTMDSMIETMQHNQDMVEQWGENQGRLMEWAGQNGYESFIPFIEDMGIDQAAVLQEMVDDLDETNGSSGEKLSEMAETYQEGGELSSNALKEALGEGFEQVVDLMTTLVERMETILRTQINEADWEQYGIVPPTEFIEGFEESMPYVEQAGGDLVEAGHLGLSLALGNYDFLTEGEQIPIDMRTGMETGSPYVTFASENLGREATNPAIEEINESDVEGAAEGVPTRIEGTLNAGKESVAWASGEIGRAPGAEISAALEGTPLEIFGSSVPIRTAIGIQGSTGEATGAANSMTSGVQSEVEEGMPESIYINYGGNVGQGTGTGITGSEGIATGAASVLASNVTNTTDSGLPVSTFEGIGRNVGSGLAGGILSMMDTVSSAVISVTSNASAAAESDLEVHSPSRRFFRIGEFVGSGMEGGILSKEASIIRAIATMTASMINRTENGMQSLNRTTQSGVSNMSNSLSRLPGLARVSMGAFQGSLNSGASASMGIMSRLSSGLVSPFRGLRGAMSGVGSNAMAGLQGGLNSRSGAVMSTARNIASRVASTMRSALKIKSPSRIMRDDVGRWIPEGIAVGIEQYASKVYSVMDAMADYVSSPFDVATPQFDIAGQVANTNAQIPSRVSHELSHQGEIQQPQPAIINLVLGGKDFSTFVDDISQNQNRKRNRLRPRTV